MSALLLNSCCGPELLGDAVTLDALLLLSTGLVISLGHCIGMCGPLVGAYSAAQRSGERSVWRMLPALLIYHVGRLLAYALIGLALGFVGSATRLAGNEHEAGKDSNNPVHRSLQQCNFGPLTLVQWARLG